MSLHSATMLAGSENIDGPAAAAGGSATGIVGTAPAVFLIAIAIGLLLTLILKPTVTAAFTALERRLFENRLDRLLGAASMYRIRDFILPGPCGGLVPVDYALSVGGGVICVRACHYRGTVFGTPEDAQWSAVDGTTRRQFMNLLAQNDSRAAAIRHAVPELPVSGLVVFPAGTVFPHGRPDGVVTLDELRNAIEAVDFDADALAAVDDHDAAWLRLRAAALTDENSRRDLDAQVSFG